MTPDKTLVLLKWFIYSVAWEPCKYIAYIANDLDFTCAIADAECVRAVLLFPTGTRL